MFRIIHDINQIPASAWDALHDGQPFLRHAFLAALESSGSVGPARGWEPAHATLWHDQTLIAAAPLYLKSHSWGEYVFDWAWADAYARHGQSYYPKWLCAVPFTPVPGARLLARTEAQRSDLLRSMLEHIAASGHSSFHLLFPDSDAPLLQQELMQRHGVQFHWHNKGYRHFEDFLAGMSHDKRKKIRQERRKVAESGVTLEVLEGTAISTSHWDFFYRCYAMTYAQHGGSPYLTPDFFQRIGTELPESCVLLLASREGRAIASSLLIRDDTALYGRYWGALEHVSCLHFEACYYAPIEYAIAQKLQRFEGGAQGEHKLARGLDPTPTQSAHWIADEDFRTAIARFLQRESLGMQHYINELGEHSAYRDRSRDEGAD
ncbi:GNAT family N-acetyltransferase [Uliginosibacterium sp. H3]|uniref:GNAT family N-acetyltransferase n=1 Tax=Uliginosibacterium silvisoli TaxID=3114758 RepID=A0ABU6K855_9RHOO|nr:GNAT family N-acetyltransferase [Uliginosibacterium sp. H3]